MITRLAFATYIYRNKEIALIYRVNRRMKLLIAFVILKTISYYEKRSCPVIFFTYQIDPHQPTFLYRGKVSSDFFENMNKIFQFIMHIDVLMLICAYWSRISYSILAEIPFSM